MSMRCILAAAAAILVSCNGGEAPTPEESGSSAAPGVADVQAGPADGALVYQQNCAICHGATGDGDGELKLDRPARSFRDGGFSFGNTHEAILRTVSNGIGGTPMPGFVGVLSPAELVAVTNHVIELGPEQIEVDMNSTVLSVGTDAAVVRGGLPPLADGGPVVPRGLLLGNADGTTFEYDGDNLRLLAVRQGQFVKRRDWEGRGGDLLEPMGRLIWTDAAGQGGPFARLQLDQPLTAQLSWTQVNGAHAEVGADLIDRNGAKVATLTETGSIVILGGLSGFRRVISVADGKPGTEVWIRVAPRVDLERIGAERCRVGTARQDMAVIEGVGARGFEELLIAGDSVYALLRLDGNGGAECELRIIPVATAEDAETLREEGF